MLTVGAMVQPVALSGPALMIVAKAVAVAPTLTDRLVGSTAATSVRLPALLETGVHDAGVGVPALLSVNTIAGNAPPDTFVGVLTRVRLLVSAVKPSTTQEGALAVPLFTLVLTTMVDPVLKTAWEPLPSPKTLNSALCQFCPRSGK